MTARGTTATTLEEHDMPATVAIETDPARVADAERAARPVAAADHAARSPQVRKAAAGRLVWRSHDTPTVWVPGDAGSGGAAPGEGEPR